MFGMCFQGDACPGKSEDEALFELDHFGEIWDGQYPQITKSWRTHWQNLNTIFNYPEDISKAIYTTNAIESPNSVIRKAIKKRKIFPSDDSAKKMIYLAIKDASKKWTMPIHNWRQAMNRFIIEFEEPSKNILTKWQLHRICYRLGVTKVPAKTARKLPVTLSI